MTAHWERDGKPSAPRVEHRYYVGDRIMVKTGGRGGGGKFLKSNQSYNFYLKTQDL